MILGYSLSFPCESRHLRYITEASTFAGEYVFGSFNNDITDNRIVRTFCVGFHLSHGSSPLCGSSIGGCSIDIQRSPFYKIQTKIFYSIRRTEQWKWFIFFWRSVYRVDTIIFQYAYIRFASICKLSITYKKRYYKCGSQN